MKKITILLTAVIFMVAANGQVSKPKPISKPSITDSLVIKGTYKSDTSKVSYFYYIEDGAVSWGKGYLISMFFVSGQQKISAGQSLLDNKWLAVKREVLESIYDYKEFNWK